MAQTEDDFVSIYYELEAKTVIDLERLETDPIWNSIKLVYHNIPDSLDIMLQEYLSYYISQIKLLTNCPSTNGPSDLQLINCKITRSN